MDKQINSMEFRNRHLDVLLSITFKYKEEEERELKKILAEADQRKLTPEEELFSQEIYAHFVKKIEDEEKKNIKSSRADKQRRYILRFIEVAACFIVVLGIMAPFALANVDFIRTKVMELLIRIEEDHTDIDFIENEDGSFEVPASWKGSYFPAYIPEGFNLSERSSFFNEVIFKDTAGRELHFGEYTENEQIALDSEHAELSHERINSMDAFIIEKGDSRTIVWNNDERYFIIYTNVPREVGLHVAESVRKIVK
jgi:hypothetical protein